MAIHLVPMTSFQPGGARGAPLPATFPATIVLARYKDAAGAVHRQLFDVITTDLAQPDEVAWTNILEWTPADTT